MSWMDFLDKMATDVINPVDTELDRTTEEDRIRESYSRTLQEDQLRDELDRKHNRGKYAPDSVQNLIKKWDEEDAAQEAGKTVKKKAIRGNLDRLQKVIKLLTTDEDLEKRATFLSMCGVALDKPAKILTGVDALVYNLQDEYGDKYKFSTVDELLTELAKEKVALQMEEAEMRIKLAERNKGRSGRMLASTYTIDEIEDVSRAIAKIEKAYEIRKKEPPFFTYPYTPTLTGIRGKIINRTINISDGYMIVTQETPVEMSMEVFIFQGSQIVYWDGVKILDYEIEHGVLDTIVVDGQRIPATNEAQFLIDNGYKATLDGKYKDLGQGYVHEGVRSITASPLENEGISQELTATWYDEVYGKTLPFGTDRIGLPVRLDIVQQAQTVLNRLYR